MPLSRYQVRNEYSLADPELYKAADKDDPEALLEGVAMAGLVGVLRQLGDLAEFAAEIFHDLHEEVMVTASRGHTLMVRVQQLESDFPPIEKAFLSQTTHSTFFSDSGTEWHPNLQMNQNLITKGDLPRFVMDSYEEARGPPRLFLLDKFDIAGAGSCLKRYTDPSFYKVEASFLDMASVDVQDRKFRRAKKKGPRWKHGETPEFLPSSKLHQLFLEERVESGASDPARLVKLKRKSSASALGSVNGKSYMEKFLKTPLEDKVVHEVSIGSSPMKSPSKSTSGSGLESQRLDVGNVGPDVGPVQRIRGPFPPPSRERTIIRPSENDFFEDIVEEKPSIGATSNPSFDDKDMEVDREIKVDESESYHSDGDDASEIDNYMDALATIESEVETDTEFRAKKEDVGFLDIEKHETDSDPNDEQLQSQSQFSDSQSVGNFTASDDGNGSIRKGLSSFSYSDDTASTSAEDIPLTETGNAEVTCAPSNQDSIIEKVRPDQLAENEASDNACTESDDKSGELESDEELSDSSEILSDVAETEEQPMNDKSEISSCPTENEERVADESVELSSGLSKIEEKSTDDNGVYSGSPTKTEEGPENVDDVLWRNDDIAPTVSCGKHLDDEAELEDSIVDSSIVIDTANILEEIHEEKGSEKKFEDVVQTKLVDDIPARNPVDTRVMSPDSFISHPEEEPSVLHLKELAGNTNDDLSDKLDSAEIGIVHFEDRDFDETRDGKLSRDSESDVEEGGIEPCANLVARDYPSHFSGYEEPPILAEDYSQSDDREDKMVHTEYEAERARNSSLLENLAQSDEREEGNEEILESEPTRACSHIEETDCITDQLDLQPLEGSGLSSQFEPIDSQNLMNNADFNFSALTIPTQPLEQDKALQVEELDVSTPLVDKVTYESSQSNTVDSNETDRESWPGPISVEGSVSAFPQASNPETPPSVFPGFNLLPEVVQVNLEEMPPLPPLPPMQWRIGKFQHASIPSGRDDGEQNNHFPPIFPSIHNENVQASNPFLPLPRHENFTGNMVNSTPLSLQMPIPNLGESREDYVVLKETEYSKPSAEVSVTYSERSLHAGGEVVIQAQPTPDHSESQVEFLSLGQTQSSNPFAEVSATNNEEPQEDQEGDMIQPTIDHNDCLVDFLALGQSQTQSSNPFTAMPETCNETPHQGSPDGEGGMIQPTDSHQSTPAITPGPTSTCSSETPNGESNQSSLQSLTEASLGKEEHDHSSMVSEMTVVGPPEVFVPLPPVEDRQPEHVEPTTNEESICSTSASALPSVDDEKPNALPSVNDEKPNALPSVNDEKPNAVPSVDDEKPDTLPSVDHEKPNGNQIPKLPRPWSPLIDAVAAHDKSKLRKVTERVRPQEQKVEERDSVLEQIRTKSFNLKPAVATRPTIQGPRTNLRVAAILEKANAIRQAFAGSDDDEDSWSDS